MGAAWTQTGNPNRGACGAGLGLRPPGDV